MYSASKSKVCIRVLSKKRKKKKEFLSAPLNVFTHEHLIRPVCKQQHRDPLMEIGTDRFTSPPATLLETTQVLARCAVRPARKPRDTRSGNQRREGLGTGGGRARVCCLSLTSRRAAGRRRCSGRSKNTADRALPVAAGTPPNVTASHASNFGLHQVRVWRLASNLEERDGWVNSTEARSYATAAATRCIQTIRQLLTACTEGLYNMKPC